MTTATARHDKLDGAEFESIIADRAEKYRAAKLAHLKRYGVQAVRSPEGWTVIKSKPDYEGVVMGGYQFVFDCKVESGSSFSLTRYRDETKGERRRQLNFMLERSQFGVKCFFLLHWNARELATKAEPSMTCAFFVHPRIRFWEEFMAGERKSITRRDCAEFGKVVPWTLFGARDQNLQPDILAVL